LVRFQNHFFIAVLFLVCLCCATVSAQQYEVFVNNRPFKGESMGSSNAILLEVEVLQEMVKFDLDIDPVAGTVSLDGEPISSEEKGGVLLVNAKELATQFGGRYSVNKDFNTIDIYLIVKNAPAAVGGPGPNTYLVLKGVAGEFITGGRRYKFTDDDSSFKVSYNSSTPESGISIRVDGPDGDYFRLNFCGPGKTRLEVGEYTDCARYPFQEPTQPGMTVSGNHSGHNTLWGEFTVHEIIYGSDGPSSFAADFVQRGNSKKGKQLKGSIRYRAWEQ
jgi:hypothetical protein